MVLWNAREARSSYERKGKIFLLARAPRSSCVSQLRAPYINQASAAKAVQLVFIATTASSTVPFRTSAKSKQLKTSVKHHGKKIDRNLSFFLPPTVFCTTICIMREAPGLKAVTTRVDKLLAGNSTTVNSLSRTPSSCP